jgi:ubiquinone/menaquinone biosynthesis C-methylase UbiE
VAPEKGKPAPARLSKSEVEEVYGRLSTNYDRWASLAESRARDRCLELAAVRDGESVLEVAVGTGEAFERILRSNPRGRNEGIDLSEGMLQIARGKAERTGLENFSLRVGDAYSLDYPENTFDVLVNMYMFDLLPEEDFPLILAGFLRVLRPGGRLSLLSMTRGNPVFNFLWDSILRLNPAWLGGCRAVHLKPYVDAAGFVGTKAEFISQLGFPSEVVYGVKPGS